MQASIQLIEDTFLQGETGTCVSTNAVQGIIIQEFDRRFVIVAKTMTGADYVLSRPRFVYELEQLRVEMMNATRLVAASHYRQRQGSASNFVESSVPSPFQEAND